MPIQYQAISEEEYKSLRYQILLNVEEGGDVALTPYRDSKGNVTIGIGFNLRDTGVRLAVLDFFGIAEGSASYLTIEAILSRVWEPEQMDDVRAALDAAIAQSGQRTQFAFTDEAEVKTFFGTFIADYETYVNNNLPAVPQFSRERAVLLSLHYNEVDDPEEKKNLLGPALRAAIDVGDRASAWYEIRYRSNLRDEKGVAKRRYYEAEVFGLYDADSPTTVSLDEALRVYAMYTAHRHAILNEELLFGPGSQDDQIADANTDYATAGTPYVVQSLEGSLAPAAAALVAEYAPDLIGQLFSLNILVGGDSVVLAREQLTAVARQGYQLGVGPVEPYLLIGRGGVDVLQGGAGADVLVGGAGNDELSGGAGADTYYFEAGSGHDTIIDDDDDGRIKIDGVVLNGEGANSWPNARYPDRPGWFWIEGGRVFFATLIEGDATNGKLLIQTSGAAVGDSITIENWTSGDLGLTLTTAPQLALLPGPYASNVWSDPNFTPSIPSMNVKEGLSNPLALALNVPVPEGAYARLELSESPGEPAGVNGAETLPFVNGVLQFALRPGQNVVNLALLSGGDFDTNQLVTLTATLFDAQGVQIGTAATMNVLFEAVVEPSDPTGTTPLNGTSAGEQILGTQDNDLILAGAGDDVEGGLQGDDRVLGEAGRDLLDGWQGSDLVEGGTDSDVLQGGDGSDRLFADVAVDVQQAIVNGNTESSVALQGDVLNGQAGDDIAIGTNRIDVLAGGDGRDVLIAGAGDDFIAGDGHFAFPIYGSPQEVAEAFAWQIVHQVNGTSHQSWVTTVSLPVVVASGSARALFSSSIRTCRWRPVLWVRIRRRSRFLRRARRRLRRPRRSRIRWPQTRSATSSRSTRSFTRPRAPTVRPCRDGSRLTR